MESMCSYETMNKAHVSVPTSLSVFLHSCAHRHRIRSAGSASSASAGPFHCRCWQDRLQAGKRTQASRCEGDLNATSYEIPFVQNDMDKAITHCKCCKKQLNHRTLLLCKCHPLLWKGTADISNYIYLVVYLKNPGFLSWKKKILGIRLKAKQHRMVPLLDDS